MLRLLSRSALPPRIPPQRILGRPVRYSFTRDLSTHAHTASQRPPRCGLRGAVRCIVQSEKRRPIILAGAAIGGVRFFHATRRNEGPPMIALLASVLKTSSAMELARTVVRVTMTFVPLLLFKNHKSRKRLQHEEATGNITLERDIVLKRIRYRTILFHALIFAPILLFWATLAASLEMTPLTGRWRLILLSPEEEEEIAAQLAGPGWYAAVGNILAQEGPVNIISPDDWRYKWVENTLRRLERAIPILQREKDLEPKWLECGPDDIPIPPPAEYPLRPRPRASEYIRRFAELSCARTVSPAPHSIAGPPYSLILVDKPESSNAFSYGFGPDGGGGVVVFSGFLDEILSKHQEMSVENYPTQPPQSNSWWSSLFGAVFPSNPKPLPPTQCIPTEEQTSELAILLAHELSHLVLAHHLETLSSGSIIYPGVISIFTDVARALLFPVTMLFGPFLNDALASMGKVGSGEFSQIAEYCTSQAQEIEADIVSARLLAHAGFDPRHAVKFWEDRKETEQTAECSPAAAAKARYDDDHAGKVMRWMGSDTHPINVQRVAKLKEELERWERVRQQMREKLRAEQSRDSH